MSKWIVINSECGIEEDLINLDLVRYVEMNFRQGKFFILFVFGRGSYAESFFDNEEEMKTEFNKIKSICLGIN